MVSYFNSFPQTIFTSCIFFTGLCGGSLIATMIRPVIRAVFGESYNAELSYWKLNGTLSAGCAAALIYYTKNITI